MAAWVRPQGLQVWGCASEWGAAKRPAGVRGQGWRRGTEALQGHGAVGGVAAERPGRGAGRASGSWPGACKRVPPLSGPRPRARKRAPSHARERGACKRPQGLQWGSWQAPPPWAEGRFPRQRSRDVEATPFPVVAGAAAACRPVQSQSCSPPRGRRALDVAAASTNRPLRRRHRSSPHGRRDLHVAPSNTPWEHQPQPTSPALAARPQPVAGFAFPVPRHGGRLGA